LSGSRASCNYDIGHAAIRERAWALCAELAEATAGLPVLEKLTFSCCGSEEFVRAVKDLHRQRIIVCGVEAHVCVQQTVIDLLKDHSVYLPADAICSRRELDATVAVERLRDCGAVITTVEAAVFELFARSRDAAVQSVLTVFKSACQWQQAQPPRCLARAGARQLPVSHGIGPLLPVATAEAKTESFLTSFFAPQCGQAA